MSTKGYSIRRKEDVTKLFEAESAQISPGIKGCEIFESTPSGELRCVGMEIQPQASTVIEQNLGPTIGVFVLACDPDLASFTLNGAKMELQVGDHLTIPRDTNFMFTNSSLSVVLKLRLLHNSPALSR